MTIKPSRKRQSYATGWIRARKAIQVLALAGFIFLFLAARWDNPALKQWSGLPFKLDPLAVLANLLARSFQPTGTWLWLTLIIIGTALLAGRVWCSWLCPLGTLLEWFSPKSQTAYNAELTRKVKLERWRKVKYGLLIAILIAALLGNMTLLIFDPLTILERTFTTSVLPALDWAVRGVETLLFRGGEASGANLLSEWVASFDTWIRPSLLPLENMARNLSLLFALVFAGIVALNWIAPRFWCRYLCPLGGLLGLVSRVAIFRRQVSGDETLHRDCTGCKLCSRSCPTGTIDPEKNYASDPAECTLCLDCLDACPRGSVSFSPKIGLTESMPYDPARRDLLVSFGATLAGVALLHASPLHRREQPQRLRPPGVLEDVAKDGAVMPGCVRCGVCLQTCPTGGLQPAWNEAGLEGLWTPVLVPRLGYCDYSCTACGQVCPVAAIPLLSLEEKRLQVIGKASIDQSRCLAWAYDTDCIVCEEMCPLPEKAVWLEEQVDGPKLPHVNRERCIGCGICEYKCPLPGPAAIRITAGEKLS